MKLSSAASSAAACASFIAHRRRTENQCAKLFLRKPLDIKKATPGILFRAWLFAS
jgi:hypothetical protein